MAMSCHNVCSIAETGDTDRENFPTAIFGAGIAGQAALEACRQFINKKLEKKFADQYLFKVIPFPHHIQRENKMLTGAGADRMQTGMQLSYGKSMGKAAILKKGSKIFFISLPTEKSVVFARKTIKQVKSKLPCKIKILYVNKKK